MTIEEENFTFCSNVKRLCENNKISLYDLGKAGLSETDINRIVRGNIDEMPIINMLKICNYFSVRLKDLFDPKLFSYYKGSR
jgi:DNA-binding Xre family transcriptional regulator